MSSLYEAFSQGRERGAERRTRRALGEYMQPALGGDQAAQQAIYGVDPDAGFKVQQLAQQQAQQGNKAAQEDFAQFSRLYASAPETMRQQMYAGWRDRAIKAGLPAEMPEVYDPQSVQVAQAVSGTGKEEPRIVAPGSALVGNDGKLIYERPFAPAKPEYQLYEGADGPAWLPKPMGAPEGGAPPFSGIGSPGQPAVTSGPALDPTQDFPQLASAFPGVQNTSLFRDPARNTKVGGVANSQHMQGTAGDFVVPAAQRQQFIAQARQLGYEAIDEGDHVHVELPPGRQAANRFGAGQGLNAIPIGGVRPKAKDAGGGRAADWQIVQSNDGTFVRVNKLTGEQVETNVHGNNAARLQNMEQERVEKVQAIEGGVKMTKDAIESIDTLLSSKDGLSSAVGMNSYLPSRRGGAAYDFERRLDTFKSQTFVPMVAQLKGMGALSDAEGKKLGEAVGALDVGMSEDEFIASLNTIKASLNRAMTKSYSNIQQINAAAKARYSGDGSTAAPDAGPKRLKYNPATGRLE